MTIREGIEKAIEGGYRLWNNYYDYEIKSIGPICSSFRLKNLTTESTARNKYTSDMLLDPKFWQCLGKAMGWNDYDDFCSNCREYKKTYDCPMQHCTCPDSAWKYHWHRMIDHLAEGKNLESFFEQL